jgi:hypothetical protein
MIDQGLFSSLRPALIKVGDVGSDDACLFDNVSVTYAPPPQGTVTAHVFSDTDGNGVQGAGEPDLAGVDITITDSSSAVQTVTTNATGDVSVVVPPGTTTADVDEGTLPAGYSLTTANDPQTATAVAGSTVAFTAIGYQFLQNPIPVQTKWGLLIFLMVVASAGVWLARL